MRYTSLLSSAEGRSFVTQLIEILPVGGKLHIVLTIWLVVKFGNPTLINLLSKKFEHGDKGH